MRTSFVFFAIPMVMAWSAEAAVWVRLSGGGYLKRKRWDTDSVAQAPEAGDTVSIIGIPKTVKAGKGTNMYFDQMLLDGGSDLRLVKVNLQGDPDQGSSKVTVGAGADDTSLSTLRGSIKSSSLALFDFEVGVGFQGSGKVNLAAPGGLLLGTLRVAAPAPFAGDDTAQASAGLVTGYFGVKGDVSTTGNTSIAVTVASMNHTVASAVGVVKIAGRFEFSDLNQEEPSVVVGYASSSPSACAGSATGRLEAREIADDGFPLFNLVVGKSRVTGTPSNSVTVCEELQVSGTLVVSGGIARIATAVIGVNNGGLHPDNPVKGSIKVGADFTANSVDIGRVTGQPGAAFGELVVGGTAVVNSIRLGSSSAMANSSSYGTALIGGELLGQDSGNGTTNATIVIGESGGGGRGLLKVDGAVNGFHVDIIAGVMQLGAVSQFSDTRLYSFALGAAGTLRLDVLKPETALKRAFAANVAVSGNFFYSDGATVVVNLRKKLAKKKFVDLPLLSADTILSENPDDLLKVLVTFKGKTYTFPEGVPISGAVPFNALIKVGGLSSMMMLSFIPASPGFPATLKVSFSNK